MSEGRALVDVSAEPMVLTIEGQEYKLLPLSMGDIASAERFIMDQRLVKVLERIKLPPLPDDVRAKTIAAVLAAPVLLTEILMSYEGRLRLLYLAMHRADPKMTWDFVQHGMPALSQQVLSSLMYKLAGLGTGDDEEEDPTKATTTEPGKHLKTGTESSAGSAAGSP